MRRIIAFVTGPIVGSYFSFSSSSSFKSSGVGAKPVVCRPFFAFDFAITIYTLTPVAHGCQQLFSIYLLFCLLG
jgi:hypothetical protein